MVEAHKVLSDFGFVINMFCNWNEINEIDPSVVYLRKIFFSYQIFGFLKFCIFHSYLQQLTILVKIP